MDQVYCDLCGAPLNIESESCSDCGKPRATTGKAAPANTPAKAAETLVRRAPVNQSVLRQPAVTKSLSAPSAARQPVTTKTVTLRSRPSYAPSESKFKLPVSPRLIIAIIGL